MSSLGYDRDSLDHDDACNDDGDSNGDSNGDDRGDSDGDKRVGECSSGNRGTSSGTKCRGACLMEDVTGPDNCVDRPGNSYVYNNIADGSACGNIADGGSIYDGSGGDNAGNAGIGGVNYACVAASCGSTSGSIRVGGNYGSGGNPGGGASASCTTTAC